MADINDYQGNAALGYGQSTGGGLLGFYDGKKTTDAMDRFAMFSFYKGRDEWNRANKEKDDMADKMAAQLAFNYGDMLAKDRDEITGKVSQFYQFFQKNPNAATLKQNKDGTSNAKEYSEFVGQRNQILQDIVRANRRKAQDIAIDNQIANIKSPKKREQAQLWKDQQISSKGLMDDLQLFPDFAVVDVNKTVAGAIKDSAIKYDDLQQGPNKDIKTRFTLVDINAAVGTLQREMALTEGFPEAIADARENWNRIIADSRGEDGKVDTNKLKKHPSGMGQSILDMVNKANNYMDYYNSDEVQKQVKTGKQERVTIDDDISDDEVLRMMIGTNATREQEMAVIETDDAIQKGQQAIGWANVANDRAQLKQRAEEFRQTKGAALAGGDTGNLGWYNLAKQANGANQNGVLINGQGYENAFAREIGGTTEIEEEELDANGEPTGKTVKTKVPNRQTPRSIVVIPDPGGDPNKFTVRATYETNEKEAGKGGQKVTSKIFTAQEAYDAMSFLSGSGKDVKALSEMNTKYRLNQIGARKPDYNQFQRYYENGAGAPPAPQPDVTERTTTTTTTTAGNSAGGKQRMFTFGGKNWTESQVRAVYEKKKKSGETFDQFIQRLNSKR